MTLAKPLLLIGAAAVLMFSIGFFIFHYVNVTNQFLRFLLLN